MQLNFTLNTKKRSEMYEDDARYFEKKADAACDENSREHWRKKAADRQERAMELRGA